MRFSTISEEDSDVYESSLDTSIASANPKTADAIFQIRNRDTGDAIDVREIRKPGFAEHFTKLIEAAPSDIEGYILQAQKNT
jgi:hypothetical protein